MLLQALNCLRNPCQVTKTLQTQDPSHQECNSPAPKRDTILGSIASTSFPLDRFPSPGPAMELQMGTSVPVKVPSCRTVATPEPNATAEISTLVTGR